MSSSSKPERRSSAPHALLPLRHRWRNTGCASRVAIACWRHFRRAISSVNASKCASRIRAAVSPSLASTSRIALDGRPAARYADRAQPCLSRVVVKTMAGRSSCARLQQAQRFVMQQRRARKPRVAGQSAYEIERRDARSVTARAVAGDRRLAADRRWENRRALLAKRMPGTAFARRSCRGGRRRRLGESIQQSLLARVSIAV